MGFLSDIGDFFMGGQDINAAREPGSPAQAEIDFLSRRFRDVLTNPTSSDEFRQAQLVNNRNAGRQARSQIDALSDAFGGGARTPSVRSGAFAALAGRAAQQAFQGSADRDAAAIARISARSTSELLNLIQLQNNFKASTFSSSAGSRVVRNTPGVFDFINATADTFGNVLSSGLIPESSPR